MVHAGEEGTDPGTDFALQHPVSEPPPHDLLEIEGPTLGWPKVDKVKGSKFHSMKELRPAGTSIRILFIFDRRRQAILLLGGDKAGDWKSWYDKNIPIAERRYENWLATEGGE